MINYLIRRSLYSIIVLILVSFLSFYFITLPPGSYLTSMIETMKAQGGISQAQAEKTAKKMREAYGIDEPLIIQYKKWLSGIVTRGDFGFSFIYRKPVSKVLISKMGWTLVVAFSALLFSLLLGILTGTYSATHKYTLADNIFTILSFLGLSIPNFFLAVVLMYFLTVHFGVPTVGGLFSSRYVMSSWNLAKFIDLLKHLWLPVIVVGTAGTARNMRVMRGNLLDVLNMQYVQVARAKGLKENSVIYKHAVKNALQPMIMYAGMMLPNLLQGALITAIVLNLPTMGPAFYKAIISQDMYLAGSYMLLIGALLVIGTLLSDIILAYVDPRIRYN